MTCLLDLDGVVWLAGRPIPGSPEAVARLRDAGETVVYLTNNSGPTVGEHLATLRRAGFPAEAADLVTSAQAAASMLSPGERAAVVGAAGIEEALGERGVEVVPADAHPDTVVVGRCLSFDYDELARAVTAIRAGARFVATNTDATYPTGDGPLPGAGALVAFVATAAGRDPEVAGKPHRPIADLVRARFGMPRVMVGDRPDTDGQFAVELGTSFVLVLSGTTSRKDLPVRPEPVFVADDLAGAVEHPLDRDAG
jgi:HAD superfamily hydrolase (TIGR01450 family)